MSSTVIDNTAQVLVDRMLVKTTEKNKDFGFIDPITILMMISIMVGVIRIIQECRKNKLKNLSQEEKVALFMEEIKTKSSNPGMLTRWKVQKLIKRNLTKAQYNVFGDSLYEALQELGANVKEEQVTALLEYKNV